MLHEDLLLELLLLLNLYLLLHEKLLEGFLRKTHWEVELLGLLSGIALALLHILKLPISHHVLIRILQVMHLHLLLLHHETRDRASNIALGVASLVLYFGLCACKVCTSNNAVQVVSFLVEDFVFKVVADNVEL